MTTGDDGLTTPSLNRRRIRATRLDVARAALELVERDGWSTLNVAELADSVGVSVRTFHRYFANKPDVFRPLLEDARVASHTSFEQTGELTLPQRCAIAVVTGVQEFPGGLEGAHRAYRILLTTPELTRVWLDEALEFERGLVPLVPAELLHTPGPSPSIEDARLVAALIFAAMRVALQTWAEGNNHRSLHTLIAQAVERVAGTLSVRP